MAVFKHPCGRCGFLSFPSSCFVAVPPEGSDIVGDRERDFSSVTNAFGNAGADRYPCPGGVELFRYQRECGAVVIVPRVWLERRGSG